MEPEFNIAPTHELIRYLALLRRWLNASAQYVREKDDGGIYLCAWIADALHNVPNMLWRYDIDRGWNSPAQLAVWMDEFPDRVRQHGAPEPLAENCDSIFSPEGSEAELGLRADLSDLDLAPAEKLTAYLDLFYNACLAIRWRPGVETPWHTKDEFWQERIDMMALQMGANAEFLADVPWALVHWADFNEEAFSAKARTVWEHWPSAFGLARLTLYREIERLRPLWREALPQSADKHSSDILLYRLVAHYTEPWRAYHTLSHIERMFSVWKEVEQNVLVRDRQSVALAIWFHDCVYDPTRSDNEEKSAAEAVSRLSPLGLDEEQLQRIRRMILATAAHKMDGHDTDTALLLDLDLSILGAEPREYDAYSRAIREEYRLVPDLDYRIGRTNVLRTFLKRERIFITDPMSDRFEVAARRNLEREIATLRS